MKKIIADFVQFVKGIVAEFKPNVGFASAMVHLPYGPWAIVDGLAYSQPLPIPHRLAVMEGAGRGAELEKYLESTNPAYTKSQFGSPYNTDHPYQSLALDDPLSEWDQTTREMVLEQVHLASDRNPLAKAAVNYTRMFAVGDGASITYGNKDVEAVCQSFLENPENDWDELEGQLCEDAYIDGELFIRFHGSDPESMVITTMPPWGVKEIHHEPGFFRRRTEYDYRVRQSDGKGGSEFVTEVIDADEVEFFAINRRSYEQRGKSELYVVLPWLKAHKQSLETKARNEFMTSILYDVTLSGATASQVAARTAAIQQPPAGATVVVHNDKEAWEKKDTSRTGSADIELSRQLKIMVAAGLGLPEFMLADGENANLATATAQTMPAIKTFEDWQAFMKRVVGTILRRVIQNAIDSGALPEEVPLQNADGNAMEPAETVKTTQAFDVQYQKLESDDPKSTMEALEIALRNELISRATASAKTPFDLDPQVEKDKMESEEQADIDKVMSRDVMPLPLPPSNGVGPASAPQPETVPTVPKIQEATWQT